MMNNEIAGAVHIGGSLKKEFFLKKWAWSLLLLLPLSVGFTYFIYGYTVDLVWFNMSIMPPSMRAKTAMATEMATAMATDGAFKALRGDAYAGFVMLFTEILAISLSCAAIGQLLGVNARLRDLFLIGLWSKATCLISMVLVLIRVLLADFPHKISFVEMDPLSWNSLWLHLPLTDRFSTLASTQGVGVFLSVFILAFAFKRVTSKSWLSSVIFALLPYCLYLGSRYYLVLNGVSRY